MEAPALVVKIVEVYEVTADALLLLCVPLHGSTLAGLSGFFGWFLGHLFSEHRQLQQEAHEERAHE